MNRADNQRDADLERVPWTSPWNPFTALARGGEKRLGDGDSSVTSSPAMPGHGSTLRDVPEAATARTAVGGGGFTVHAGVTRE